MCGGRRGKGWKKNITVVGGGLGCCEGGTGEREQWDLHGQFATVYERRSIIVGDRIKNKYNPFAYVI